MRHYKYWNQINVTCFIICRYGWLTTRKSDKKYKSAQLGRGMFYIREIKYLALHLDIPWYAIGAEYSILLRYKTCNLVVPVRFIFSCVSVCHM